MPIQQLYTVVRIMKLEKKKINREIDIFADSSLLNSYLHWIFSLHFFPIFCVCYLWIRSSEKFFFEIYEPLNSLAEKKNGLDATVAHFRMNVFSTLF